MTALDLSHERRKRLIAAVAERILAHADELTALDSAIGRSMKSACERPRNSCARFVIANGP